MSDDLYGGDAEVLEISEDAVREWVTAWREFADGLEGLGDDAKWQSQAGVSWGDLDSIQQLERLYRNHLGSGSPQSLAGRIEEFVEEAKRMANALDVQFSTLADQDALIGEALTGGDR